MKNVKFKILSIFCAFAILGISTTSSVSAMEKKNEKESNYFEVLDILNKVTDKILANKDVDKEIGIKSHETSIDEESEEYVDKKYDLSALFGAKYQLNEKDDSSDEGEDLNNKKLDIAKLLEGKNLDELGYIPKALRNNINSINKEIMTYQKEFKDILKKIEDMISRKSYGEKDEILDKYNDLHSKYKEFLNKNKRIIGENNESENMISEIIKKIDEKLEEVELTVDLIWYRDRFQKNLKILENDAFILIKKNFNYRYKECENLFYEYEDYLNEYAYAINKYSNLIMIKDEIFSINGDIGKRIAEISEIISNNNKLKDINKFGDVDIKENLNFYESSFADVLTYFEYIIKLENEFDNKKVSRKKGYYEKLNFGYTRYCKKHEIDIDKDKDLFAQKNKIFGIINNIEKKICEIFKKYNVVEKEIDSNNNNITKLTEKNDSEKEINKIILDKNNSIDIKENLNSYKDIFQDILNRLKNIGSYQNFNSRKNEIIYDYNDFYSKYNSYIYVNDNKITKDETLINLKNDISKVISEVNELKNKEDSSKKYYSYYSNYPKTYEYNKYPKDYKNHYVEKQSYGYKNNFKYQDDSIYFLKRNGILRFYNSNKNKK